MYLLILYDECGNRDRLPRVCYTSNQSRSWAPPRGNFGTVRAQLALRRTFMFTESYVVLKPELHVFTCSGSLRRAGHPDRRDDAGNGVQSARRTDLPGAAAQSGIAFPVRGLRCAKKIVITGSGVVATQPAYGTTRSSPNRQEAATPLTSRHGTLICRGWRAAPASSRELTPFLICAACCERRPGTGTQWHQLGAARPRRDGSPHLHRHTTTRRRRGDKGR